MNNMWNRSNDERETIVRSDNDVDNRNRIVDRNTNTAIVQNSGNSTVNVRININEED
jgi:hypothetical protein